MHQLLKDVETLRQEFNSKMSKLPQNLDQYRSEVAEGMKMQHQANIRAQFASGLKNIADTIGSARRAAIDKKKSIEYPALTAKDNTAKLAGELQLLSANNIILSGDPAKITAELKSAIRLNRQDAFSVLAEYVKSSPDIFKAKNGLKEAMTGKNPVLDEANKIIAEHEKVIGIEMISRDVKEIDLAAHRMLHIGDCVESNRVERIIFCDNTNDPNYLPEVLEYKDQAKLNRQIYEKQQQEKHE
jgi:hypothetical protein